MEYDRTAEKFCRPSGTLEISKIKAENGNYVCMTPKLKTQEFVIISNCGFPGENNFDVLRAAVACCNPSLEIYVELRQTIKKQKAGNCRNYCSMVECIQ